MKVAVAQTRPIVGAISSNLAIHLQLSELAAELGAQVVVFPELSLVGYEPRRIHSWSASDFSMAFPTLQEWSDRFKIAIGVGVPFDGKRLPSIGMYFSRPEAEPWRYTKRWLHEDEVPYFEPASLSDGLMRYESLIALAICYELSVVEHARQASRNGAAIYMASVAKSSVGRESAYRRLSEIARTHSMHVLMANCLGELDGMRCDGQSAVWNPQGALLSQLDNEHEGVLVLDTLTGQTQIESLSQS
jgi:predicted amidohydrolase